MKTKDPHIISIPKPCHENWEGMAAADNGRFCGSCQHTVVDFTAMTDQEMLDIFKTGQPACGRFLDTQLHRPLTAIPARSWFFRSGFINKVAAALLIFQSIAHVSWAQDTACNIRGRILDKKDEPLITAIVQAYESGVLRGTAVTDLDGNYEIKPISAGRYYITIKHSDYKDTIVKDIMLAPDQSVTVTVNLNTEKPHGDLQKVIFMGLPISLVDRYNGGPLTKANNSDADRTEITHMGKPMLADTLVALQPGVYRKKTFWQRINIFRRKKEE